MTNLSPETTTGAPILTPVRRGRISGLRAVLPTWSPRLGVGLGLVAVIALFGIFGPLFVGDPDAIRDAGLAPPGDGHLLGLTQTGQDVFAQLAYATRGSLQIGLIVGVLATVLSAFFGVIGAYAGGAVDEVFSLFSNVMLVIPGLPLVIVIAGFVPPESRGAWTVALVLAITGWAASARVLRAQTLSLRNRDYVAAARVAGEKRWRIITVEILPNLLPLLASQFVFAVIAAILSEAGLSFLGLGASNSSTLGTMLYFAQNGFALQRSAWWWFVPPGLVIALFGCGLALINFSIDEIINPKLRVAGRRRRAERPETRQPAEAGADVVLSVDHLDVVYRTQSPVHAVKDVSLTLRRGEILGLAGESGCGKTTLAYAINRLHRPPAEVTAGTVVLHDRDGTDIDVLALDREELRAFRWDRLSMVFQGAMNALNPVTTVRSQLDDVLTTHRPDMPKAQRKARCEEVLRLVGVDPGRLGAYPHELSGGMRQRVMIAMALLLDPQVMIMDEPTTALDVVVQRGILKEILRLRDEFGFAAILITHDLPLLLEIADRIAVMKDGEIVEDAAAERMYRAPSHPYTRTLLESFPSLTGERGAFLRDQALTEGGVR
ncbi:oligopeptide/dipeptide ABC transporter ATPase/permease [Amycolatopsis mediterranei S699]|uniref:Fused ATPase and permease components of ABC-type oligopeptide/dipeptide transport system n=2 Tax=Amycolatopsis mediterranei TaxID=33910 RepID=A0A0H3D5G9_AMYMU|nr:dipeptide/oligopeptide/nickel ABC transporter permease/ATP-binding protein [Amycolatopsis mediterranei]ADJ45522.1 fused ATPase and permease components of ABC-type oligopeptide/dipeptide transport system [Amycolatopsis mediterranei U32]AEK42298.1 oligopeptide/dipeptide ABC transporter ATPase/permease [Amycolatopsis mediterranei S699]AFO77234.1 oligopeptide/dipeptide ABC transporter ATPase/permease [Amycolatopsis mediterranei S699]AGT84362.1 oligopeptide/dipeptide ABC transporter ATPase/permea